MSIITKKGTTLLAGMALTAFSVAATAGPYDDTMSEHVYDQAAEFGMSDCISGRNEITDRQEITFNLPQLGVSLTVDAAGEDGRALRQAAQAQSSQSRMENCPSEEEGSAETL